MALTKCPHCGHTVLSVASRCPGCGQAIGTMAMGPTHKGDAVPCRSCGRQVRRRSATCPNCGATNPGKRMVFSRGTVMALGLVAVVVVVGAIWARSPGRRTGAQLLTTGRMQPARPARPATLAAGAQTHIDSVRRHEAVAPAKPEATPAAPVQAPPAPTPVPAPAVARPATATRWTSIWANVRSEPRESASVVRVLRPGTRVEGVRNPRGWWLVYVGGDSVGYVAGMLLATQPPDSPTAVAPDSTSRR